MTTDDTVARPKSVGPTEEHLHVTFPATAVFTRIGRVAVVGLALRLGVEVAAVERLRNAVDLAVSALLGLGRVEATASWTDRALTIELANPEVAVADRTGLTGQLEPLVGQATVDDSAIRLILELPAA